MFPLLQSLLHDDNISDIPVVVLANKTDRKDAVGVETVVSSLGLSIYRTGTVGLLHINQTAFTSLMSALLQNIQLTCTYV